MSAPSRKAIISRLSSADLFSSFQTDELNIIAEYSAYRRLKKDAVIFRAGSPGEALYIIDAGEVVISKQDSDGKAIDIARFLTGDCFGEQDMLTGSARTASARTGTSTRLLRFPKQGTSFKDILAKHPAISAQILHKILVKIAGRIRKANSLIKENSPLIQELKKQVYRDKLTGLFNKTFLEEELGQYLAQDGARVCLLMIKPDNFKLINDTYGHEAGDQALKIMARALENLLQDTEVAIRFMGNELAVVMPDCEGPAARSRAQEIQQAMSSLDLRPLTGGDSFCVTVSVGIAAFPRHARVPEQLIEQAHALPLIGRSRGGNQILFPEDG
jgi:diguanylate cyclase (GGDEF)-like protein